MTRRDTLKVAGAAGMISGLMGCVGILTRDENDASADGGDSSDSGNDSPPEPTDRNGSDEGTPGPNQTAENRTNATTENETNQSNETEEYPEAANPEPNVTGPNESAYATPEDGGASEPTVEDIGVEKGGLKTDSSGATATGTLTNNHDDVIDVIDVEVTFLENGQAVTTNMWGTNDLASGESWDFEVRAEGSEYSTVDDFDVAVIL